MVSKSTNFNSLVNSLLILTWAKGNAIGKKSIMIPGYFILHSCMHSQSHILSCRFRAQIIDGKAMAKEIKLEVREGVRALVAAGEPPPQLTAIIVGEDPASHTYVRNKMKAAEFTGISSETIKMPATVSETELLAKIHELNNDYRVNGILVQLPVPEHISERKVCNAIAPEKDVDGFHVVNVGRFCTDLKAMVPATPAGVIEMLKRTGEMLIGPPRNWPY